MTLPGEVLAPPALHRLMRPRSVAVVGATDRAGSYGAEALRNLEAIGFPGPVWGVNPRRQEVLGRTCVPSLADLPEPADAVVVAIPAAGVTAAIEDAGARGCGGAVVLSAGFGELAAGTAMAEELVAAAARHRLAVCGPNCNGIVSPHARTALWGDALPQRCEPGRVALVSQSGNVAVNALSSRRGLRFHTVIASGNQAVLGAADYLEYLARAAGEEGVGAVALYLEDDGGPRLVDGLAACADAGLPVVVLKVGWSPAGARAAAAHSAALAGDQRVFQSLVAEAGAEWAQDVHELLELAKVLAVPPRAAVGRPGGLAIMTCSGGDSAQGADEAQRLGLALPELAPDTRARLAELLPWAATPANPLDYTAMIWGDAAMLGELTRTLGEDPGIGQVLVFYDQPPGLTGATGESWRAVREGLMAGAAVSPVPTLVCSTLPELLDDTSADDFHRAGVPTAAGLRTGLRCAAAIARRGGRDPDALAVRLREIAATARACGRGEPGQWLAEHAGKARLREAGVPVPDGRVAADADDALAAWRELGGGPVAVKLSAPGVQHKTELGGVLLDVAGEAAVAGAAARIAEAAADVPGAAVLVERMAPSGVELIVAAHLDGIVPALVVGLGGVWAEALDDVAVVVLPARARRIERAIAGLRGAAVLRGARGGAGTDVAAVAAVAERVGQMLVTQSLATVECNPVLAGAPGEGAVAVDAALRKRRHDG